MSPKKAVVKVKGQTTAGLQEFIWSQSGVEAGVMSQRISFHPWSGGILNIWRV